MGTWIWDERKVWSPVHVMDREACAGPQLISVEFMREDLCKEPGLINTACLASHGREQELTNIFVPDNYFNTVPPTLSTEASKMQYMICVLANMM